MNDPTEIIVICQACVMAGAAAIAAAAWFGVL
jgi:hypothetical protein